MSHNPERLAAAYLAGMRPRARRRYEAHLLDCESCWQEVLLARRGRELAESVREVAPAGIREYIRAAVSAASVAQPGTIARRRRRMTVAAAGAAAALVVSSAVAVWRPLHQPSSPAAVVAAPPSPLSAAVASFRAGRLPGTAVPAEPAPDLSPVGLHLVAAGAGQVDGTGMTMFAYRSTAGTRLAVYRSTKPIPEVDEAHELGGPEAAWSVQFGGVTVVCGRGGHTLLLLASDRDLVHRVGALLDVI